MINSVGRIARVALVSLAMAACAPAVASNAPPAPSPGELPSLLAQVSQDVVAGRYGVADRVLSDFATRYPASPDAVDVLYWRALFKLDPANQIAGPRDAAPLLERYLSAPEPLAHRAEAMVLQRIATAFEARQVAAAAAATAAAAPAPAAPRDDKAKDDEIAKLKDDLAKANAELERIKRRVASPKP
jgi:hypothetical protein